MKKRMTSRHFGEGDHQRDDRVVRTEVDVGHAGGERRADQQRDENSDVNRHRNDVIFVCACCSDIAYGLLAGVQPADQV